MKKILFISMLLIVTNAFSQTENVVTLYENGNKQSEGPMFNGMEHGHWKFWSENGSLYQEADYWYGHIEGNTTIHQGKNVTKAPL